MLDPSIGNTVDLNWLKALQDAVKGPIRTKPMSAPFTEGYMWWAAGWRSKSQQSEEATRIARDELGQASAKRRSVSPAVIDRAMAAMSVEAEPEGPSMSS